MIKKQTTVTKQEFTILQQNNYLSSSTEEEAAGAAGSTDKKGDVSDTDVLFNPSIRLRASSQVSLTSGAGSEAKLFLRS